MVLLFINNIFPLRTFFSIAPIAPNFFLCVFKANRIQNTSANPSLIRRIDRGDPNEANRSHSDHLGQFYESSLGCMPTDYSGSDNNNPHSNVNNNMTTSNVFDFKQYEVDKMYSPQCKRETLYCYNNARSIKRHSPNF